MKPLVIKWGVILGVVYVAWLYLSYYLGMHTDGLAKVQVMVCLSLAFTAITLFLALRALKRDDSGLSYSEGLKSGGVMSVIGGLIAAIGQVGYFQLIHPGFTDYMVGISKEHFEADGISGPDLEAALEASRVGFGMKSYMVQSGVGLFIVGIILSAIFMLFLRRRN